jgi:GTPase SAR1 family protein
MYSIILTDIHAGDSVKDIIFVGRKEQLNQLFNELDRPKSTTIIVGEEGIGKSTLIQEFCKRLKNRNDPPFIGNYDNNSVIENDSQSLFFPFIVVLETLLSEIQNTARTEEKTNITKNRLRNALEKFAKQKGKEISGAIITDIAKKIGLEESIKVAKEFWRTFEGEKSIIMVTQDYISKHKEEVLSSYVAILTSIVEQFHDRKFVLIFDQFESAKKTSIDFFINFVKRMPQERFHIIISLKTHDASDDNTSKELYEYALKNIKEIGADTIEVSGLSEEEIGEWIMLARKQKLSIVPDLRRIREVSSGFPLLLNQWINMPISDTEWIIKAKESAFGNVNRGQMCELIDFQKESFSNDPSDRVNLNKIAVLTMPLKIKELAKYLAYDFDLLYLFLERLVKSGLFVKKEKYLWYKHNLIQQCLENGLSDEYKQANLEKAANFYLNSLQEENTSGSEPYNDTSIGCAYYFHRAGFHDKSLEHNVRIARMASNYGDLDLAEKCYQRAIIDAQVSQVSWMMS